MNQIKKIIQKGTEKVMAAGNKINQTKKLNRWIKGFVSEGLQSVIPTVEGIVYLDNGRISAAKSSKEALDALEKILGGTATKWIKRHPDEYTEIQAAKAAAEKERKWQAEVERAREIKRARNEAIEEFESWYGDAQGSRAKMVRRMMAEDKEFRDIMTDLGRGMRTGQYWASDIREKFEEALDKMMGD